MSNHEKVMSIMMTDPEKKWSAPEIASIMYGEQYTANQRNRVNIVLRQAEPYGFVKKHDQKGRTTYWVLA